MESSEIAGSERPALLLALTVQKYWAESMSYFKAVRSIGIENVE